MNLKNRPPENHMAEIIRLLSIYQALPVKQLMRAFPELPEERFRSLIRRLLKSGRVILQPEQQMLLYAAGCKPDPSRIAAFWILLDFQKDIIYHTASDFPVALTFCTQSDAYDVIHIPEDKEILMNHALSAYKEDSPRRIAIVDDTGQIPLLHFPGITAFCTVTPDGKVQYYRKQGVTDI